MKFRNSKEQQQLLTNWWMDFVIRKFIGILKEIFVFIN